MNETINNKLLEQYKTSGPLTTGQIGDVISSTPTNAPITSSSLENVKPLSVPSVNQPTTAAGISGIATSLAESTKAAQALQREQEQKLAETQTKTNSFQDKMLSAFQGIKDIYSSRNQLETDAKIGEKAQKVTDVTNQIEALDRAEQNEIKALDTQPLTLSQKAQRQADLQRQYAFQKAELALVQSAANRDLATAQNIVDRKVELALEPLKLEYDFVKTFYEENKKDFNEQDKRLFDLKVKDSERTYNEAKTLQETIGKLQLSAASQGADPSIVQAIGRAKTQDEAIQAAGQYAGDILERQKKLLEIDKLNKEIKAIGAPVITNPQAGQYAGALNIILGSSSSLSKDQKNTIINAVNNGQDPFSVIKNQAKNIMGQTNATKLDNYETAKQQLVDVQTALEQYYAAGGDTSLLKGNYEKVINKLGEVKDPNLVQISTQIQSALQIYRNAVSGTAYSVQEGADIASIFPGINKSEGLNKAVLTGRMNAFDSTIDATYKNVLGDTYTTLKKAETAQQVQDVGVPKVIPQTQVPEGYYQASDGLFYKK